MDRMKTAYNLTITICYPAQWLSKLFFKIEESNQERNLLYENSKVKENLLEIKIISTKIKAMC